MQPNFETQKAAIKEEEKFIIFGILLSVYIIIHQLVWIAVVLFILLRPIWGY